MSFRVHGTVVEAESGRPLPGIVVRVYDKDIVLDDFLGEARTDAAGGFEVAFTEAAFRDVLETKPDLYVLAFDPSGKTLLHSTERAVRYQAGRDEFFEIRIPRGRKRSV
jgi:hypothetical protein